jgi:hypothetical protein
VKTLAFFQYLSAHEPTAQLATQLAAAYAAHTPPPASPAR